MHTPHGFEPAHALPAVISDAALAFAFRGDRLLVAGDPQNAPAIPTFATVSAAGIAGAPHFLGWLAGTPCMGLNLADDAQEPPGMRYIGLRSLFFKVPDAELSLAARAFHIVDWDRCHRFCGRCGTPTRDRSGERAKECPQCGLVAYPRIAPAMMALVTRGREMLLARAHRFPPGRFSALAGFVEPGESIEDCVRREVREEVGLEVAGITYFDSQPWAFPHSLMVAYTAEYAGGDIRVDDAEIAEARWFTPESLPSLPPSVSIARRLIDATAARLAREAGDDAC
ncbi:MAG: NAD(+) diphosphatase [Burkholderiales bacterium]